ncbi:MAG: prolyl-tRNA synthetase associated domain-containing protein [Pseudomonadota bacterium]
MTATDGTIGEAGLYALFDALGIGYRHFTHPPLHTVEESRELRGEMPGAHVKNMFLKARKGGVWLVTCLEDRQVRIKDLEKAMGAKDCSFGKPDLLWEVLGVLPGAVTPFALANPGAGGVRFVLDAEIMAQEVVNAHPLHNEATVAIATADLEPFLAHTGHAPQMLDFAPLEEAARAHAAARAAAEDAHKGAGGGAGGGAGESAGGGS